MKELSCYSLLLCILIFLYSSVLQSQNRNKTGVSYISQLVEQDSLTKAEIILNKQLLKFKTEHQNDSLVNYIILVGSLKLANNNSEKAFAEAEKLVKYIKKSDDALNSMRALLEFSTLYYTARNFKKNYEINEEAASFAKTIKNLPPKYSSQIEYNLGTSAISLENLQLGKEHLYKSKKILESNPNIEAEQFYLTYNSIGRIKASVLELDSSNYYYNKSLKALEQMESSPMNQLYRAAIVKQNIGLNLNNSGQIEEGIKAMEDAIIDFKKYSNVAEDESKRNRAIRFRLATIDNLAGFYSNLGDVSKSIELMTYSYNEKRKTLPEDDPNVIISSLILGHANLLGKNLIEAGEFIDKALKHIEKVSYYKGYALMVRASIYDQLGEIENAKKTYEASEALFREQSGNQYPIEFMDALLEMSTFYAKNGWEEKGRALATESYMHTQGPTFENELTKFYHTQNMALVNYSIKDYQAAKSYSDEALAITLNRTSKLDSIQNDMRKPTVLYVNAKSRYQLQKTKDVKFLESLLSQIENGIRILEQRKSIVSTSDDLSKLLAENKDLFDFAKQLRLDLYEKTKDKKYLEDLMAIHESGLYNRIRSRLNLKSNIAFMGVPNEITKREKLLKNNISKSLNTSDDMLAYFKANSSWSHFLDTLKQDYPKYYKMRYATIEEPLNNLQNNIPKNTTLVRYLYIENTLYAFVADKQETNLFKLNSENIDQNIADLSENNLEFSKTAILLSKLYKQLWLPFETTIKSERIIIIPDGALFNLSFETLTPTKIKTFKDLSTSSLLSKYIISYNYSLLLLNKKNESTSFEKKFVAFAPEFNDGMKSIYKKTISDSLTMDHTYLSLLPQPFSINLAKKYADEFKGESFVNDNASKISFTNNAKNHKIIYIGTHAESNNLSPELSRLVFAKSLDSITSEDNSLYSYEIYDTDLASNLAILTACETGKPSYQSGEGMISLAHAFNYAGSESILTSLWKIDEQSSAKIIESFYKYLKKGWTKDKALQQAKLDYIATAEGRTAHPQYWAGLILIGDTAPIQLNSTLNLVYWILAAVVILLITYIIRKKRKSNKLSS